MEAPQRQSSAAHGTASSWIGRVPAWVLDHPSVASPPRGSKVTTATARHVLQTLANRGSPDRDGHIVNIIGGKSLALAARLGHRTMARYVTYLIKAGVVVILSRGGQVERDDEARTQFNAANTYGIPARPGGLDHRRAIRREQLMKPTDAHDKRGRRKFIPDIIVPGEQATIWPKDRQPTQQEAGYDPPGHHPIRIGPALHHRAETRGSSSSPDTTESRAERLSTHVERSSTGPPGHYPYVPVALPPCPRGTPSKPCDHLRGQMVKHHGASGAAREGRGHGSDRGSGGRRRTLNYFGGPCIRHIADLAVLRDISRLVALYQQEHARGAVRCSELEWVGAAIHALRIVKRDGQGHAPALFASLINRGQFDFIGNEDEGEAQKWLKTHQRREWGEDGDDEPEQTPQRPKRQLSEDARTLLAAEHVCRGKPRGLVLDLLRREYPLEVWTAEKIQRIHAEMEGHRHDQA